VNVTVGEAVMTTAKPLPATPAGPSTLIDGPSATPVIAAALSTVQPLPSNADPVFKYRPAPAPGLIRVAQDGASVAKDLLNQLATLAQRQPLPFYKHLAAYPAPWLACAIAESGLSKAAGRQESTAAGAQKSSGVFALLDTTRARLWANRASYAPYAPGFVDAAKGPQWPSDGWYALALLAGLASLLTNKLGLEFNETTPFRFDPVDAQSARLVGLLTNHATQSGLGAIPLAIRAWWLASSPAGMINVMNQTRWDGTVQPRLARAMATATGLGAPAYK